MNANFSGRLAAIVLAALLLPAWSGCGPRLGSAELGTVMHELPTIPGADTPYHVPEPEQDTPAAAGEEPADAATQSSAVDPQPSTDAKAAETSPEE